MPKNLQTQWIRCVVMIKKLQNHQQPKRPGKMPRTCMFQGAAREGVGQAGTTGTLIQFPDKTRTESDSSDLDGDGDRNACTAPAAATIERRNTHFLAKRASFCSRLTSWLDQIGDDSWLQFEIDALELDQYQERTCREQLLHQQQHQIQELLEPEQPPVIIIHSHLTKSHKPTSQGDRKQ